MCATGTLIKNEELEQNIVEKYNDENQQERIKASMIEIIDNLEKLYFINI